MKLLHKPIRSYLIYSTLVLFIAIPVFYFVIQQFVLEEVDEGLAAQKELMVAKLKTMHTDSSGLPEAMERGISLIPLPAFRSRDTIYSIKLYDDISNENIPYRILESNVMVGDKPYQVKLKSSLLDSEDLIKNIVAVMAALMVLMIAGLLIINQRITRKIWKPFYDTLNKLHHYQIEKNEPARFEKTNITEFTDLNKAITALTQRNQQIYQSQKEFTENASHEMQTPLAIFQGKVELLMQTTPLNREQAGLISDLADASQRLNRYNKSLLLLTKIENNLFLEKEPISIKELVERLIEQYRFQIENKHITLQNHYAGEDIILANRTLIEILFSNLLSNAIRYNRENGMIRLLLKGNVFMMQNTGADNPLNPDKIFGRFQKESTDLQSVGLGLAIAQKIVNLYHYELTYIYGDEIHSFSFRF
jgi:signal transduction histidine kinase